MKYIVGIDSGSTTTKMVLRQNKTIIGYHVVPTGANSLKATQRVLEEGLSNFSLSSEEISTFVATGYGRENIHFAKKQITEITCHAKGVHWLFPQAEVIIDIGGQDFKVIKLGKNGAVQDFRMNDRCAAGTGRFLDVMVNIFQMDRESFCLAGSHGRTWIPITNVCTVFAETEVVNHIARGTPENEIIAGIFDAVATRVFSLAKSLLSGVSEVVFTGGVAKNVGMVKALERKINCSLLLPEEPQITGALGATLFA